jgi:hypothetical protein
VAEWLMAPVLKTGIPERVSGVRIPPSPPRSLGCRETRQHSTENRRKLPQFCKCHVQTGPEKVSLSTPTGEPSRPFLRRAHTQSGLASAVESSFFSKSSVS